MTSIIVTSIKLVLGTIISSVIILRFRMNRSGQTVQTHIRLLLEEQSDQCLHCLPFHQHLFGSQWREFFG